MPTDLEAVIERIREKFEAATQQAELYGAALRELKGIVAARDGPEVARKPKAEEAAAPAPTKRQRAKPIKAEVTAADAVLRLLVGCKLGLPAPEIIQHVSTTYGHRKNSISTTLYNLKRKGAIVLGEDGIYRHPDNVE